MRHDDDGGVEYKVSYTSTKKNVASMESTYARRVYKLFKLRDEI